MLTLPIKKQWFDMIQAGVKKEEYRNISPFYHSRFAKYENEKFWLRLRNGYASNSPSIDVFVSLSIGKGRPEWGAEPNVDYYVLTIHDSKNYM